MKLRIERIDKDGNTVAVLYQEHPVDASLRERWVAFMEARGFTGPVLAQDAVKAGVTFAAVELARASRVVIESSRVTVVESDHA